MTPLSRFTFFHSELDPAGVVVKNPIGWDTVVLSLERDTKFHSLIEYFKGNFLWYDDAMEIIKGISNLNEDIVVTIDLSYKAGVYINISTGQIKLFQQEEIMIADRVNYKMTVPIIRDSFWTKFVNRLESPVDLQATLDLDGNARAAVNKIVLPMPSQRVRQKFNGAVTTVGVDYGISGMIATSFFGFNVGDFMQIAVDIGTIDEIQNRFNLPTIGNVVTESPSPFFKVLYGGDYSFNLIVATYGFASGPANETNGSFNGRTYNTSTKLALYIQVNNDTPIAFTPTNYSSVIGTSSFGGGYTGLTVRWTDWAYSDTLTLADGDEIRFYAEILDTDPGSTSGDHGYFIQGKGLGVFLLDMITLIGRDKPTEFIEVIGDTTAPDTETDAYLIKDAAESIVSKIVGQNAAVKSDYLDTCKGFNAICRGKHMRGYSFSEKAFSMSFDEWWKGADPLLFLGLGYTEVGGVKKIEIEDRATFFGTTPSVNISNVNKVVRRYDLERIYKTIEFGYKKALSESDSGIDDTQTKRIWNTDFASVGVNEKVVCEWMAASLAIERSRRNRVELGKDDRNDEEIMVIALVEDGADWLPEFGTVFNAVTNLINSDYRINIRHSATRLFKRAQAWFNGCMLFSTTGAFTFNRGEGNYEMTSQFETTDCEATDDPEPVLDEGADIVADTNNILFVPKIYEIESAPMSFETYQNIIADKNNAIGISRTSTGHVPMHILDLGFEVFESRANLLLLQATQNGL